MLNRTRRGPATVRGARLHPPTGSQDFPQKASLNLKHTATHRYVLRDPWMGSYLRDLCPRVLHWIGVAEEPHGRRRRVPGERNHSRVQLLIGEGREAAPGVIKEQDLSRAQDTGGYDQFSQDVLGDRWPTGADNIEIRLGKAEDTGQVREPWVHTGHNGDPWLGASPVRRIELLSEGNISLKGSIDEAHAGLRLKGITSRQRSFRSFRPASTLCLTTRKASIRTCILTGRGRRQTALHQLRLRVWRPTLQEPPHALRCVRPLSASLATMFSTCVRCRHNLGQNHALNHLPVGRRIAYELTHGRVWVICPRCGAWNLTPIDDRWEALEECERHFGAAPARASDAAIGLAQLDGLELVRIGPTATRSDIANRRYGARLRLRRTWFLYGAAIIAGLSLALVPYIPVVHPTIEYPFVLAWGLAITAVWIIALRDFFSDKLLGLRLRTARLVARVPLHNVPQIRLRRTGDHGHIGVILPSHADSPMLVGAEALAYLSRILPLANWRSGSTRDIETALALVERAEAPPPKGEASLASWERLLQGKKRVTLVDLPTAHRLALEMAIDEAVELKALQGRAIRLQPAWQEAEEVAAIADDLLMPPSILTWLSRLKSRKDRPPESAV